MKARYQRFSKIKGWAKARLYAPKTLSAFYADNEDQPVWLTSSFRAKSQLRSFTKIFEEAWTHGLNPEQYHAAYFEKLTEENARLSGQILLETDVVLSDAIIRYGQDVTGTRINPA